MFTGIIESVGKIVDIATSGTNKTFFIQSDISSQLKIDQSVSHSGVCMTVEEVIKDVHRVTAVLETLDRSTFKILSTGDHVNLERSMRMGDRLDGHMVQGHVDQTATCISVKDEDGSWLYTFAYDPKQGNITVEKGSITVNGVSLTVVNAKDGQFSVAIIPYTYEHTNFNAILEGTVVNLEFDILGKYIAKLLSQHS